MLPFLFGCVFVLVAPVVVFLAWVGLLLVACGYTALARYVAGRLSW